MPTTRISAGLLALAIAILVPATAAAAPPVAQPDSVAAAPTGTLDVLGNDSDPDGDALSVSANSQGANGAVQCGAMGACLYTATAGFTGADSFTYTVRAPDGETSTATVTVNVSAQTAQAADFARDDEAVTAAGREVV